MYMWPNPIDLTNGNGIDISPLSKGIYILKVMNDGNKEVASKKFVKIK